MPKVREIYQCEVTGKEFSVRTPFHPEDSGLGGLKVETPEGLIDFTYVCPEVRARVMEAVNKILQRAAWEASKPIGVGSNMKKFQQVQG